MMANRKRSRENVEPTHDPKSKTNPPPFKKRRIQTKHKKQSNKDMSYLHTGGFIPENNDNQMQQHIRYNEYMKHKNSSESSDDTDCTTADRHIHRRCDESSSDSSDNDSHSDAS
eukprot:779241_1